MSAVALESVRVLVEHLPLMRREPTNIDERSAVLYGAYLAGAVLAVVEPRCITRRATCSAALQPRSRTDERGRTSARLGVQRSRYWRRVRATFLGGGRDAAGALYDLARTLDTPNSLSDIGFPADGIDAAAPLIAQAAVDNVRPINVDQARALLVACVRGERP